MSERSEQIAAALLVGSLLPVLVVVWVGLMNEGFSSLGFLFCPGPETWLQLLLVGLFLLLLGLSLSDVRARVVQVARTGPSSMFVTSLAGAALASTVLYLVGFGETPWRKFYTYLVAPRAVSAWLLGAVVVLFVFRRQTRRHAA